MEKIPVGQSIGGAYGFLFGRILTIIGLSWLPAAFYAVGRLYFIAPAVMASHGEPPQAHLLHLALFLFSLLMISAIAVSLTREALGVGGEHAFAHFVIGGKELRLFLALVRFYVLLIVLIVALAIVVTIAGVSTKSAVDMWGQGTALTQYPVHQGVIAFAALLSFGVVLYAALRLTFLLGPVTVLESHAKLSRAWALSAGNFWRMLAVYLGCVLPVLVCMAAVEYAVMGQQMLDIAHQLMAGKHPDPAMMFALPADDLTWLVGISAVGMVLLVALFAGASATAYRALVPRADPQEPQEEQEEQEPYGEPPAPLVHHDSGEAHHTDHAHDHNHDHGHNDNCDHAHESSEEHSDAGEEQSGDDAPEQDAGHGHRHEEAHESKEGREAAEEHAHANDHASGHDDGDSGQSEGHKATAVEENHDRNSDDQKHGDDRGHGGGDGHGVKPADDHADNHGNGDDHDKAQDDAHKDDAHSDHGGHSPLLSESGHPTDLRG